MAKIIDGREISAAVKQQIKEDVVSLNKQGIEVGLAVIIVGDDPASKVYVANKEKACEQLGITSYKYALPAETTNEELLSLIEKLNNDKKVNGILCQLPLPKQRKPVSLPQAGHFSSFTEMFLPHDLQSILFHPFTDV